MSSVNSSFPDYFTVREVGAEVSLGNYSILKILCISSSAKGSGSTWGQAGGTDMWVTILSFIKHLAEQTVYQFPIRSFLRCRSIWSKDSDMQTRIPTLLLVSFADPKAPAASASQCHQTCCSLAGCRLCGRRRIQKCCGAFEHRAAGWAGFCSAQ